MANNYPTLLIEIGTEELPPRQLNTLCSAFANSIATQLEAHGFSHTTVEGFVSPRRIAARLSQVPSSSPSRTIQRKGPSVAAAFSADGSPTRAALGFAKSCNTSIEQLQTIRTPQGEWLAFEQEESGQSLEAVLSNIIQTAIAAIPATKYMRWGDGDVKFLRPIHWIACLHGMQALTLSVWGITTTAYSYGHRYHCPEAFLLRDADAYVEEAREHYVMVDQHERQKTIQAFIEKIAREQGGIAVIDPALLDQVTGLVEWPVPLYAHFDKTFLEVPQEALISSMQNHQKCFPIKNTLGKLLPTFILISNTEPPSLDNIIQGNERVMHARLADAKFFYDQDRKTSLSARLEPLKGMIFQKKLGSLYDKSQRVATLAAHIGHAIGTSTALCERAAKLYKADLMTEMVFEFPELQGIMGNYYARHDKEPEAVAQAIQESYLPRFAKDQLPETLPGIALALADRLDTLIGIFGIGQAPTGDKDPYALRRQALAILRILIEKALPLDLAELLETARQGYGTLIDEENVSLVLAFCLERFKGWAQEQGATPQTIDAILANPLTEPYDAYLRIIAMTHFQSLPEANSLASANKRARNILQKSGISITMTSAFSISEALLEEPSEQALFQAIQQLYPRTSALIHERKYQEALTLLATLQVPVDRFFDSVMVMEDNEALRNNRVALLCQLCSLFGKIADLSRLVMA